jgi:K+-transporting ATPase A subunit
LVQIAIYFAIILALTKPLGGYMTRVFAGERTFLSPVLLPVETLFYRLSGEPPAARATVATAWRKRIRYVRSSRRQQGYCPASQASQCKGHAEIPG